MASPPRCVLLISSEYPPEVLGGMGSHVAELARGLAARAIRVVVLCPTLGASSKVVTDGGVSVHFVALDPTQAPLLALRDVPSWIGAWGERITAYAIRALDHLEPDLIHFHDWPSFATAHSLAARFAVPKIGTVHLLHDPLVTWWGEQIDPVIAAQEARMLAATEHVITVSASMAAVIRDAHPGLIGRLHVVHNGLDAAPFARPQAGAAAQLRARLGKPGDVLVLFAGRLNPQKGVPFLIDAAAQVVARHAQVRTLIVGEAASRDGLREVHALPARHPELAGRVAFLGKLPRNQLALLYQAVDLAVVPSVYEPFGYAAVEAMAAGVPTVASAAGGLAEIIDHERTGLLVPVVPAGGPRRAVDVAALAGAQLRLIDDVALARRLGADGRAQVLERFTRDRMVTETLEAYAAACR